jgi:hypothetical protein
MSVRKYLFTIIITVGALGLISWGATGHRTIGRIAENHLTPVAKAAVHDLLGDQSLADVAIWADEVRREQAYAQTAPWHFLNLPLGLTYDTFEKQMREMGNDNVYGALTRCEQDLLYKNTPRDKKIEDLKFIVHFVGDLHQPMHISRAEDRGGNTIQVNYEGKGTNLHSLWDTKLLEHQGLNDLQLAERYDHITDKQIRQWQSDPLMKWIWESYEISSQLYAEVDAMKGRTIDNAYYQAHIGIIRERVEQAGIRLAGVLNEIFKGGSVNGAMIPPPEVVTADSTTTHKQQTICDKVYGSRVMAGSQMTLLNLGGVYPNQKLTIMIKGRDRAKFPVAPEVAFQDKNICVTGTVINYKGKPEVIVTDPGQIKVE